MAGLNTIARAWVAALMLGACTFASAASTEGPQGSTLVSQVAAQLAQARGVRAQFVQTQSLQAMQKPLVSNGTLLFMRDQGAVWRIEQPTRMTYVITDSGVTALDANDKPMRGARNAAGVAQVSRMMRAMLAGDLSALYSQFNVNAQGNVGRWHLKLTPAQPQLAQALRGLDLSGDTYVRSIRIQSASGDETHIEFMESTRVEVPNAGERTLLGAP